MDGMRSFRPARAGVLTVAAIVVAAGTSVVSAAPAAATISTSIQSTSWSYIDSAQPGKSFADPAGDAPVGARITADGRKHVSKSYFTFDLSGLRGAKIVYAEVAGKETAVADCSAPRATEMWVTAPAKKPPTWLDQPTERSRLEGPGDLGACPSDYLDWAAAPALQQAIDAGRSSLTLVLRQPEDRQQDPRFGRTYRPSLLAIMQKNQAPAAATQLTTDGRACADRPVVGPGETRLSAVVTDPDDYQVGAEFAWWPAGHPDQRQTQALGQYWTPGYPLWFDVGPKLADATTYDWQVRGTDSLTAGPWSRTCRFSTDFTAPATAPKVTSADYPGEDAPAGGQGVPGVFTFDAQGDRDVVGFVVGDASTHVAASRPGGTATFTYTPRFWGLDSLDVWAVDAAGNRSPGTSYGFWVDDNEPSMTCAPEQAWLGETRQCTFAPHGTDGATAYVYKVDSGPETTVPAGPDGRATITVTPTDAARNYNVGVQARMTNGNLSAAGGGLIPIDRGLPTVDVPADAMVGKPVVFTLHATLPGSVSFTYDWDRGAATTVPVGPDGTAQITIVPDTPDNHWIRVHTTTGAGLVSGTQEVDAVIATNGPTVTSTDYPDGADGKYVTTPGTFKFSSPVPGVVSYAYTYLGTTGTVAAGPDGTASAELTPLTTDSQVLEVKSTFADGTVSQPGYYRFYPRSAAPPVTCDATGTVRPGQVLHCTATPVQPGLVSYGYTVTTADGTGPDLVAEPAADGTAKFEVTAPPGQNQYLLALHVWSANAAGLRTDVTFTGYWVEDAGTPARNAPRAV